MNANGNKINWTTARDTDGKPVKHLGSGHLIVSPHGQHNLVDDYGKTMRGPFSQYGGVVLVLNAPEPQFVPWTRETCPVGAVVKNKSNHSRSMISYANGTGALLSGNGHRSYGDILGSFAMESDDSQGRWKAGDACGTVAID